MPTPILKFARRYQPEPKTWTTDPAPDGTGEVELLLSELRWLVFDLDRHPGKPDGVENWLRFCEKTLGITSLPRTWVVKTKSGGRHIYYYIPSGVVITLNDYLPYLDGRIDSVEVKTKHIRSPYDPGYVLDTQYMDSPARLPQPWIDYLENIEKERQAAKLARKSNKDHSRLSELVQQYNEENDADLPQNRKRCFTAHGDACWGRLGDVGSGRWFCKGGAHPEDVGQKADDGTYTGDMVDVAIYEGADFDFEKFDDNPGRTRVSFIKAWAKENGIQFDTPAPELSAEQVAAGDSWVNQSMEAEAVAEDDLYTRATYEEESFVHRFYDKRGWRFSLTGEYQDTAEKILNPTMAINKLFLANAARSREMAPKDRYKDQHIERAIENWQDEQRLQGLSYIRERIDYRPSVTDQHLHDWLQAVVGTVRPLDVIALKQFIWLVKRKVFGLYRTEFQLMPIVFGKTAGGKTTAVTNLLGPVKELHGNPLQMGILSDERHNYRLNKSFVLFFDEMAWTEKTNLEALKRSITSEEVEWRAMRTNRSVRGPNNATLIGASEKPVRELIHDTQGARRFWQLDAQARLDWDAINRVDYQQVWQCVDQNQGNSPYRSRADEMMAEQNRVGRAISSVEEWIAEESFERTYPPQGRISNENDLYTLYAQWMKSQFREKMAFKRSTFHEELEKLYGKDVFGPRTRGRNSVYLAQPSDILSQQGYLPVTTKVEVKPN